MVIDSFRDILRETLLNITAALQALPHWEGPLHSVVSKSGHWLRFGKLNFKAMAPISWSLILDIFIYFYCLNYAMP